MPQLLSLLPRRGHRHPWHLLRCSHCRKMILNSVAKCPHCATWREDARAFSVSFWALVVTVGLTSAVWLGGLFLRLDRQHQQALEDEREYQQRMSEPAHPTPRHRGSH